MTGTDWVRHFKVIFPKEAAEFVQEIEGIKPGILKYTSMYVRVEKNEDEKLKVMPLGTRRRGKGDKATYKW